MPESSRTATVAVLDYPGPSMPARTKSILLGDDRFSCTYPLDLHLPHTTSLPEYAAAVVEHIGDRPDVVVAYCAAAPIAREAARRFAMTPRLVLVNPEVPDADRVVRELASFLAGDARPTESEDRQAAAAWLADGADPDRLQQILGDQHLARLEDQFGGPQPHLRPIALQLASMQVAWIHHLAAGSGGPTDDAASIAIADEYHLVSADHPCRPDCTARHEVFGESAEEIFSGRRLADAVAAAGSRSVPDRG
ncbi:hypothetical protein KGQ19_07900 [Catenulispora sp. NL8]|uniref:Uncharacterized protein n=1 Tax=Catenulispora pinistramenti TaxID=2705254 RepID=A0ABS5KL82_9ACTN|nr:hypothetical protein [Catenulispora pinistramenti]MBS2546789.1 hypothetical protein [Catenulispora pinistramenti]